MFALRRLPSKSVILLLGGHKTNGRPSGRAGLGLCRSWVVQALGRAGLRIHPSKGQSIRLSELARVD